MQCEYSEGCLKISGEISCQSINKDNMQHFLNLFKQTNTIIFSEISHADSACIALLVAAKRTLGEKELIIRFTPDPVRNLLKLYELEHWITYS